ncbi:MAG: tryptophan 2,3-dioxygenase family protein [Deltaproteobacteria bacterium]
MTQPQDLYSSYLRLDRLLDAQTPWSNQAGQPAHDEMLFIIFHQTYELWFRQVLFELDDIQRRFSASVVDDRDMQPIVARLDRIAAIWRLLVRQLDVLETMAPQDFLDFRESLRTASGFQSWQFRQIEARLGLRRVDRIPVFHGQFDDGLDAGHKSQITQAESSPNLYDQIDGWLARTPFVDWGNYKFWEAYRAAVDQMLDSKAAAAKRGLVAEALATELEAIDRGRRKFHLIFDEAGHDKGVEEGLWRMSWRGLQAALLITLYRQEPIFQMPARLLSVIMDVDELLALWRYRHALMVQRMMGTAIGTGGSAGYGYLMATLERHRIFSDLYGLATYLIPSHALPPLPESLRSAMGYRYHVGSGP